MKLTHSSALFAAVLTASAGVNAESTYTANVLGADIGTITNVNGTGDTPDLFAPDSIIFGGAGSPFNLEIEIASDGRPVVAAAIQLAPGISGLSPAAIIEFSIGVESAISSAAQANSQQADGDCVLDTSVSGTVSYDCTAGVTPDLGNAAVATIPYNLLAVPGDNHGVECTSGDMSSTNPAINGCSAAALGAACPAADIVYAGYDYPTNGLNPGPPIPMERCTNEEYKSRVQQSIAAFSGAESFDIIYNYTGSLNEPSFAVTGVFLNIINDTTQGVPRVVTSQYRFGDFYSAIGGAATLPSTVTTLNSFSASSKNVPAMGAFGLAALFGGLVAVAARLRRRVA